MPLQLPDGRIVGTPEEQEALRKSKKVGYQYTPEEAIFLGYTRRTNNNGMPLWYSPDGSAAGFGGGLPRKGRSTAAALALGAAAPLGALAGAQLLPALASGGAPAATGIPAGSATIGPGVGMGAGGVPVGSTLGGAVAPSAGSGIASGVGTAASAAGGGLPFWAKAAMGFGSDALKTFFANKASGKANEALQAGGDKAIATFKDALGPYMNLGGQAAGNLGFLMGTGPLPGTGGGYGTASAPVSAQIVSPNQSTGRTMPEGGMVTGQAIPRPQAPPNMVDPRGFGSLAGRLDPARAQTQSSFVRMVNPAGEVDDIPADKVQDAIRMFGARPVDGPAAMGRG